MSYSGNVPLLESAALPPPKTLSIDENSAVKTTVFDLIWKLKRELERQGHEKIDLHRFTHDQEYRRSILLNVDITELPISKPLQQIYTDLLTTDELELIKEVEFPQEEPVTQSSNTSETSIEVLNHNNKPIYIISGVIIILLFSLSFMLFDKTTEVQSFAHNSQEKSQAPVIKKTVTIEPAKAIRDAAAPLIVDQQDASSIIKNYKNKIQPSQPTIKSQENNIAFRIQGSNTIGEVLAPELIKAFYKSQGATDFKLVESHIDVEKNLEVYSQSDRSQRTIPIYAHGSSTGFKALASRKTDLAMASRRIKDKEVKQLTAQYGDLRSKSTEHIIGMDGLAVIINPNNPISDLNTEQLAKIFSGTIKNWKELGGKNQDVAIFARDSNSGTWDSFKSMVLKKHGATLSADATRIESSVELSDHVSKTPGAIGFIGLPYVLRAKALAISDDQHGQPIYPTSFTISTEDYPLVRRLYIYEPSTINTQSEAHQFIEFALSKEGQEVVKQAGFISQNVYNIKPMLTDNLPQKYIQTVKNAQRLSLNFRFNSGTFVLDNKAVRDLERVVQFFETNPGQQAMLIGFSDSIGDPLGNQSLSLQRAKAVESALISRGINIKNTIGLGEMAPIASNTTKAGRERNRRVEIWVNSNTTTPFNTATR